MKAYMAPMEGITNYVYRQAYHACFSPMDKYFTPFITAKENLRLSKKEVKEISPEENKDMVLVPQILGNHAGNCIRLAEFCKSYGHREVNLNLGCPSGTVTAKGKGAGFLREPGKLERFLDELCEGLTKLDIRLSIKTRIGGDDLEEWEHLMKLYEKYPIEELIVHPRLLIDQYKGVPHMEAYRQAEAYLTCPLCYNGNLFTPADYERVAEGCTHTQAFMYGRGLIRNPGLLQEIREGRPLEKAALRAFHDHLYEAYGTLLSGDRNVLFRMKELWSYLLTLFEGAESCGKKIKKAQTCRVYEGLVEELFQNYDLQPQGKGTESKCTLQNN